jgi:hypothetical protein
MPQYPIVLGVLRLGNPTLLLFEQVILAPVTRKGFYLKPAPSPNTDGGGEGVQMSLYQRELLIGGSSSVHFVPMHSKRSTIGRDTKRACIYHSIDGLALLTGLDI